MRSNYEDSCQLTRVEKRGLAAVQNYRLDQSSSGMPTANQATPPTLRMRSMGLAARHSRWWHTALASSSILKSPFGAQANASSIRATLSKRGRPLRKSAWRTRSVPSPSRHCCRHPSISPFPSTLYVPVDLHLGLQIVDHPDLTGRIDAADHVSVDRNSAVQRATTTFEMGMTPIPPLNFTKISSCLRSWLLSATTDEAKNPPMRIDHNRYEQTLFHDCTSILIFTSLPKTAAIFIC